MPTAKVTSAKKNKRVREITHPSKPINPRLTENRKATATGKMLDKKMKSVRAMPSRLRISI
jgi:hypothetical protein